HHLTDQESSEHRLTAIVRKRLADPRQRKWDDCRAARARHKSCDGQRGERGRECTRERRRSRRRACPSDHPIFSIAIAERPERDLEYAVREREQCDDVGGGRDADTKIARERGEHWIGDARRRRGAERAERQRGDRERRYGARRSAQMVVQANDSGSLRKRLPVAAASALATAGAIGGTPGSPTPVGL